MKESQTSNSSPADSQVCKADAEQSIAEAAGAISKAYRISDYRTPVSAVKHLSPSVLFPLRDFNGSARSALAGFLSRYKAPEQTWMREQKHYLQLATLAAASECYNPMWDFGEGPIRSSFTRYDAVRLLKCGRLIKPKGERPFILACGDPLHCPSCNKNMRVDPAKQEFLPCFQDKPFWYGLTISATNNPDNAGVHLEIGRDGKNKPIYEHLLRLADLGDFACLRRFSSESDSKSIALADATLAYSHWLIKRRYFLGLAVVRDVKLSFYPDPGSVTDCTATILPHLHGFGNAPKAFTQDDAQWMYLQYVTMLIKAGRGTLLAYPDIYLVLCQTPKALDKTINYVIKPYKLAKFYIEGLSNGCPVDGLNYEFHSVAWSCRCVFRRSKSVVKWGNTHPNSPDYCFVRQFRKMTQKQVKLYLEGLCQGLTTGKEDRRYERHLKACEQQRLYKMQKSEKHLTDLLGVASALQQDAPHANSPKSEATFYEED